MINSDLLLKAHAEVRIAPSVAKDLLALIHETLFAKRVDAATLVYTRAALPALEAAASDRAEAFDGKAKVSMRPVEVLAINLLLDDDRGRHDNGFRFARELRYQVLREIVSAFYDTMRVVLERSDVGTIAELTLLMREHEEHREEAFADRLTKEATA